MTSTISWNDFHALADGGGGPDTITRLREGVLSRNLIMIAAILELAEARVADQDAAALESGFSLLADVQATAPAAVSALVSHPHVGLWAARCLGRLQGRDTGISVPFSVDIGRLAAVGAAAAIRAGFPCEVTVPMWDGTVLVPSLGLAMLGSAGEFGPATIRHTDAGTEITGGGRRVRLPDDPTGDAAGWQGMRRLVSEAGGRRIEIELDDLDPGRNGLGKDLAVRLASEVFTRWQSTLDSAWSILAETHADRADSLSAGLVAIVPAVVEPGSSGSVTSRYGYGSVVMSLPRDGAAMADTMIHEFQHSKLYALMELIPLYLSRDASRHYSPWREDPRPFGGILQGAYAYLGVTDFWQHQRAVGEAAQRRFADFEFARWRGQVLRAVDMMLDSGQLTELGETFVRAMGTFAARWQRQDVPPRIRELAETTVADHWLLWRLYNLRVDGKVIEALTAAWLAGRGCSGWTEAARTVEAGVWQVSGRLRLAYREMRPSPPGTGSELAATAADVALINGDDALAARCYQDLIAARPDEVMAWAGLAQALGPSHPAGKVLSAAPEVVFALYRAIIDAGRKPPAVPALAEWLGSANQREDAAAGRGREAVAADVAR